jgi:cytochrome c
MRLVVSVSALVVALALPAAAADVEHGKQLFKACAACHSEKADNKLGPSLAGVVGRKAGALESFRYSAAMTRSNLTWDEANLREYITDPQTKVKGNRMPFAGIKQPSDADDIVAYLATLK